MANVVLKTVHPLSRHLPILWLLTLPSTKDMLGDCIFDHVILLLSNGDFEHPPPWLSDNFTILEGGTHATQSSRNKLIVFEDGTYIELFNWISEPKEFLAWKDKKPGLIDFALTSQPPVTAEELHAGITTRLGDDDQDRIGLSVKYSTLKTGSRLRKDIVEVKCQSSRPISTSDAFTSDINRTDFPFFCHDITNRNVRIPFDDESKTTHPCGAVGISTIAMLFPKERLDHYATLYEKVLGVKKCKLVPGIDRKHNVEFEVAVPIPGRGKSRILMHDELRPEDEEWLRERGAGIQGIELRGAVRRPHGGQRLGEEGVASTIFLEG